MSAISLYELNQMVSRAVSDRLPSLVWVEAELMEAREVNGHCYMELVQKDPFSPTPVARASAKCWRSQWQSAGASFLSVAGSLPRPGMKLLLRVRVDFHPTYGFALIVNDIDAVYTIGDMARKRQEIIAQLKRQGVLDLQRTLRLPLFCQRIAVVSSPTAAGYGDFLNQLQGNARRLKFEVTLFPAIMQGEQVEQSIIAALDAIASRADDFDCVVMIRGGGAVADMSGFDTLELAENVANFPLPVITGIGHERDECVLDVVAFMKVKTPTAAAALLVENLSRVLDRVEALAEKIRSTALLRKTREEARVENLWMRLAMSAQRRIDRAAHRLELLAEQLKSLDPDILLKRGYSMTLIDGVIVKDSALLKPGQTIETRLASGALKSTVSQILEN